MIELGDCRDIMRRWIDDGVRVQMCVTSPPYWGLRDYGVDGQLGLEPTPDAFVANMVEVFGLVRELLADDGVLWLNLGDSYAGAAGGGQGKNSEYIERTAGRIGVRETALSKIVGDIKPKDLVGIPWRVAFALQAAGWWLRSDIIWSKPNPMPESVTDRPTKAHEYLFLLAKRERYYYDAAAIFEPHAEMLREQSEKRRLQRMSRAVAGVGPGQSSKGIDGGDVEPSHVMRTSETGRNRRTVWEIATQPYSGAHFATFPEALVEPCILAGSRPGDVVLDPFMGSGTVGRVAERLGRKWRGCELNPAYIELADERTKVTAGLPL